MSRIGIAKCVEQVLKHRMQEANSQLLPAGGAILFLLVMWCTLTENLLPLPCTPLATRVSFLAIKYGNSTPTAHKNTHRKVISPWRPCAHMLMGTQSASTHTKGHQLHNT